MIGTRRRFRVDAALATDWHNVVVEILHEAEPTHYGSRQYVIKPLTGFPASAFDTWIVLVDTIGRYTVPYSEEDLL